jgi:hypothetical protein
MHGTLEPETCIGVILYDVYSYSIPVSVHRKNKWEGSGTRAKKREVNKRKER